MFRSLLLLACLAVGGCGNTGDPNEAERWGDGRTISTLVPERAASLARIADQLRRIADALDRAHPVEGGGK